MAKYLYFSGGGTRGDNTVKAAVHLPLFRGDKTRVRLTEGEKKADYATRKTGVWTWSFPGVDHWPLVVPVLNQLGIKLVVLAFDSDYKTNSVVVRQLHLCAKRLVESGFNVEVEVWAGHKGIDDLLTAGGTPAIVPDDPVAWTLRQALDAGVSQEEIENARNAVVPLDAPAEAPKASLPASREKEADAARAYRLMVEAGMVGVFHNGADYIWWERDGKHQTLLAGGDLFTRQFTAYYLAKTGQVIKADNIKAATLALIGSHLDRDETLYQRKAYHDGRLYVDLGTNQYVIIDKDGWTVSDKVPIKFIRHSEMGTFPVPTPGGNLQGLRSFFNCTDDDFLLIMGWILQAYLPDGGHFHLTLRGVAGSAKSTTTRICKQLTDPMVAMELPGFPPTDRDLMISAYNTTVPVFDNLQSITPEVSDVLCRLATGGEMRVRKLFTDAEETRLRARRPVILNGIPDIVQAGDLAERMLSIDLHTIPPRQRRGEAEIWGDFDSYWPKSMGLIFSMLSSALRNRREVTLDKPPRMLDAAKWIVAGLDDAGVNPGAWEASYWRMRDDAMADLVSDNSVSMAILRLAENGEWEGSPDELFEQLSHFGSPDRYWPKSASRLSRTLRTLVVELESIGVLVTFFRKNKYRGVRISKKP
jgi:hypothetical protein